MESTIKIIKQFFKRELGSENDIQNFIKDYTDNDLERLESLKKDVLNEIENQKFIDEIGIRDRIDKPIQQGVVIRSKKITPEQSKKMIADKKRLDGYSNLKKLLKVIDNKILSNEGVNQNDKREKHGEKEAIQKPHKDDIYREYERLKREKQVKDAFYSLCDWIEELGFEVSEYINTDTPQNFDKSYRVWLNRK